MWCCHYPRYVHPWENETMQMCVLAFLWEFCLLFLCGWSKNLHNYAGPKEFCHSFMPVLSGRAWPHKCLNVEPGGCVRSSGQSRLHRRSLTVVSVSGEPWRPASFTSLFWASCSRAPRTCCDPRSSQPTQSWRAGACGRFTAAWCCWRHSCSALTTCPCSAAACWSRRSSLSSSGRNSTTTQLR